MRLSKIKMSGFKSFVDSTVIHFPSDLVGIVGPNGCGKSNIIDAVRWVMGESSRHLRGDTMEDVIFNGSSSRKPVGQASIELSFDNSDSMVGGQYAQYNEIAVRREVARDGQSKYFLNNTRCRRRDVIDIFLGTGLGPRAYAIIEQGMISRLIEAKPEELRVYLEEAAGISKYKERRRETENRIGHTRENLDRLNDLREEVEKQLSRLQRQARMAERYKVLKREERFRKAELLALRWRAMRLEADEREKVVRQQRNKVDKEQADLRAVEAEIEKMRAAHAETNQAFNDVQGRYYKLGSDISRTEQSIQHGKEMRLQQQEELEQTQGAWDESKQHIAQDRARLDELSDDIAALEKEFEGAQTQHSERAGRLEQAEQAMAVWQNEWEDVGRRAGKPEQITHVESTRARHLEQRLELFAQREIRLDAETSQLSGDGSQAEIGALRTSTVNALAQVDEQGRQLKENQRLIDQRRAHIQSLGEELTEAQGRNQDLRGRLASLEALQEAALGKRQKPVTDWLDRHHLAGAPRLAQQLAIEPGWERALETVLGQYLEAVCVDGTDAIVGVLGKLKHGNLTLLDTRSLQAPAAGDVAERNTLLEKVKSPWPLDVLLAGIFVVDDLGNALALRETLTARESVVTKDGIWLSRNWLRVARDTNERAGVLAREQEVKTLTRNLEASEKAAASLLGELSENRESLRELERSREQLIAANNRAHRIHAETEAKLGMRRAYLTELESRRARLNSEYSDVQAQMTRCKEELAEAQGLSERAQEDVDRFDQMRSALAGKRDLLARTLNDTRQKSDDQRIIVHKLTVRLESQRTAHHATRDGLARMEAQSAHLARRREGIAKLLAHSGAPIEGQEQQLGTLLSQRLEVEGALTEARAEVHNLEAELREKDKQRLEHESRSGELREEQATLQLALQEVTVRAQTVDEQITTTGFGRDELLKDQQEVTITGGEERVARLERQISRLGAINLVAIDEYEEQKERKEYLDRQFEDVTSALETLEQAMHKIDKETRHRFKDTFERVNVRLQEVYPQLFGGGRAHLELTGTDLLTTGVAVMARPPGKRLSTIHLLSGGEKALTAVALVFAIFELNPAPFCMLDEVDAPLDEANVGRFCELVRGMVERVQFIVITHNKTTMEFLDQLVGVTMQEAGVSRLVAVDIEEAAQMAAG